ncbi:hypothetical protein [Aquimarina sp. RZ0]|uniref:hypothetical protein n=1 Tax=Aquimarina sp. RZ0 TaxID=2607730 RepID=UPI0011F2F8C8|nr:hypothetical protein [Aquimarina sp. RZ0]KAA1242905.1 hypothetical protein F0000_23500 [Aquimarina sp. RZ0]
MSSQYLHIRFGVFGGTVASTIPSLGMEDFLSSGILAVLGATISYFVSISLKTLHKYIRYWLKQRTKANNSDSEKE